ncbi:ABC transporter permease [Micromonospora schwarzwaldensis]|uniref:ABC transporter permease n=1 Tax=Micromonospora sp. DSM 45708 TaxID=3111767 RepID=UPI0031DE3F78
MGHVRFYLRSLGAHIRAVLEYQSDFWILVAAGIGTQTLGIVFLGAVFARVQTLNGWTFGEVVLIYALAGLAQSVVPVIADGIWELGKSIHDGNLDYYLVRPYPPVLQVMSSQVGFNGVGDTVGAGILLGWALFHVDVGWTVGKVLVGAILLVSAIVIRVAITVASNSVSFWVRSPFPMFATAVYHVGELARYPISIYGFALKLVVVVVVPFAFAGFVPASWLLDKGGYGWLGLLTPVVAVAWAFLAYRMFHHGLRRYESAGN